MYISIWKLVCMGIWTWTWYLYFHYRCINIKKLTLSHLNILLKHCNNFYQEIVTILIFSHNGYKLI